MFVDLFAVLFSNWIVSGVLFVVFVLVVMDTGREKYSELVSFLAFMFVASSVIEFGYWGLFADDDVPFSIEIFTAINFLVSYPFQIVMWTFVYLLVGTAYGIANWFTLVRREAPSLKECEEHLEHLINEDVFPKGTSIEHYFRTHYYKMHLSNYYSLFVAWLILWLPMIVYDVCNNPLRHIGRLMYSMFGDMFLNIAVNATKKKK